jgi:hypothetical protein
VVRDSRLALMLCLSLLMLAVRSPAAPSVFLLGGLTGSNQTFHPDVDVDLDARWGISLGAGCEISLTRSVSVASDVSFVRRGAVPKLESESDSSIDLMYLSIPVVFKARFPAGESEQWYLGAGPRLDILLSEADERPPWIMGDFEPRDMGIDVCIGLSDESRFVELRSSFSLTDCYRHDGLTARNRAVSLLVGIGFKTHS